MVVLGNGDARGTSDRSAMGLRPLLGNRMAYGAGRPARSGAGEILPEPRQHTGPGVLGRLRVIAGAGVVEERVPGARIDDDLVDEPGALERLADRGIPASMRWSSAP